MLQLLRSKFLDVSGEFRVFIPQIRKLTAVMLVDLSFDGVRAGQRRFLRNQGAAP